MCMRVNEWNVSVKKTTMNGDKIGMPMGSILCKAGYKKKSFMRPSPVQEYKKNANNLDRRSTTHLLPNSGRQRSNPKRTKKKDPLLNSKLQAQAHTPQEPHLPQHIHKPILLHPFPTSFHQRRTYFSWAILIPHLASSQRYHRRSRRRSRTRFLGNHHRWHWYPVSKSKIITIL